MIQKTKRLKIFKSFLICKFFFLSLFLSISLFLFITSKVSVASQPNNPANANNELASNILTSDELNIENNNQYDTVIIGAGGGGLAAAATLAKAGKKVLVIEQHSKVGGYMTGFKRGDYNFEVSLHALNGLNENDGFNKSLWKKLGLFDLVRPIAMEFPYRATYPELDLVIPADPQMYKKLLLEKFPHQKLGINNFFKALDRTGSALKIWAKYNEGDILNSLSLMAGNPLFYWPLLKYYNYTFAEMLDDFGINDIKLRAVVSWLMRYTGQVPKKLPATLMLGMITSYHYGGYYYVEGGSQSISNALASIILSNGGKIKLSTLASKIVVKNNQVTAVQTSDGVEYKCRYVISNANAFSTFYNLIGEEYLPSDYLNKLKQLKIGPSLFQVYLGVDYDYRSYFKGSHSISISNDYDQNDSFLYGYDSESNSENEGAMDEDSVLNARSILLTNYSAVDKQAAPIGKNVIVITAYFPYNWKNNWYSNGGRDNQENQDNYKMLVQKIANTFIKRVEKILPNLSSHIEVMDTASPLTMKQFTLNPEGAVYGWAMTKDNGRLPIKTPIKNLYLVGAWSTGSGQNGVMQSGVDAAQIINKQSYGH